MTDTASASASTATAPVRRGMVGRVLFGLAAAGVLVAGGLVVHRSQHPKVMVVAPPEPVSSEAPVVEDVITQLDTRLKEHPDDAEGWRMLGWSHFQTGDYAGATAALRKATRLDPTHAQTFSFLGESLVLASKREGRIPPEARRAFEKAIRLDPRDGRARYFRALSFDLAGQHRRAINAWFDQLKETPPDAPYADDLRTAIRSVGAKHKIDVEKRLAEVQYVPPPPAKSKDAAAKDAPAKDGAGKDGTKKDGIARGPAAGAQPSAVKDSARGLAPQGK